MRRAAAVRRAERMDVASDPDDATATPNTHGSFASSEVELMVSQFYEAT